MCFYWLWFSSVFIYLCALYWTKAESFAMMPLALAEILNSSFFTLFLYIAFIQIQTISADFYIFLYFSFFTSCFFFFLSMLKLLLSFINYFLNYKDLWSRNSEYHFWNPPDFLTHITTGNVKIVLFSKTF